MSCCDGWNYGKSNGECPECGAPTTDGQATTGCHWSPESCSKCGAAECDDSC